MYDAMGWKELDTLSTQNVYFWTPNSEILAKNPGTDKYI